MAYPQDRPLESIFLTIMLLTIMLSCLCARPPGESPQIPEHPPIKSQSPSPAVEPAIDNRAPSECLVETRRDGLLLTFNEPLPENGTENQVSLSLAADLTDNQVVDPPMIQGVVKSPDGRRAFFHIPTFVLGSKFNITITSTSWPEPILAQVDAGTPHLNSTGPDFAASVYSIQPALSRTPPQQAIVLFDGSDTSQFVMRNTNAPVTWTVVNGELVSKQGHGDILTAKPLGDGLYHIEWLSPPGGDPASQKNGNSGIKFEERYELQILNNAGDPREALLNEAGSIYRIRAADVNASMGPGRWQTYHVWYTAPCWQGDQKTKEARMTVYWNDVLVHDDVSIPTKTGASIEEGPAPGRLLLQDHASSAQDEVRYRNVWHVPAAQLPTSLHPPAVQSTSSQTTQE